eukprot:tig00000681_g3052.t1
MASHAFCAPCTPYRLVSCAAGWHSTFRLAPHSPRPASGAAHCGRLLRSRAFFGSEPCAAWRLHARRSLAFVPAPSEERRARRVPYVAATSEKDPEAPSVPPADGPQPLPARPEDGTASFRQLAAIPAEEVRAQLVKVSALGYTGLTLFALLTGKALDVDLGGTFAITPEALGLSLAGTAPLLAILFGSEKIDWEPLKALSRTMDDVSLAFRGLSVLDFAFLATAAGVCEELFFRAAVQTGLADRFGDPAAVLGASVLFSLAHAISPQYIGATFIAGLYFGWMFLASHNIAVPMLVHALYDFVAFNFYAAKARRRAAAAEGAGPDREGGPQ